MRKWSKKVKLTVMVILAFGMAAAALPNVWFGLPSSARLIAAFGSRERAEEKRNELENALKNGVAERSEFRERDNLNEYGELARLSPWLDMARSYNPDEFHTLKVLASMYMRRSLLPKSYAYGNFYFHQMAVPLAIGRAAGVLGVRQPVEYLFEPDAFAPFYVCGRLWVWCFFAGSLFLTLLIGGRRGILRALPSTLWFALLPAAALAACTLKPDIPVVFWCLLALYFVSRQLRADGWRFWLLTGAAIGCAAATKYTGAAAAAAPFVIFCHNPRREWKGLLVCGAAAIAVFAVLTPALWLDFPLWWSDLAGLRTGVSGSAPWPMKIASGFVQYLCVGRYPVFLAIAALFFLPPVRRNPYAQAAVGFFAASFLLTCMGQPDSDSYLLPGYAALATVAPLELSMLKGRKIRSMTVILLLIAAIFPSLFRRAAPNRDVRLEAAAWVNEHVPAGSSIGMRRYPVSYRSLILDPAKYDLRNELENGKRAVFEADYYIDSSFEWDQTLFLRPAAPHVPPGCKPVAEFGTPTVRRRNYFTETVEPFFVIYSRVSP